MAEIKLIKVTYQQRRLDFFKKQLDKATRSMNYHVKRKHHPDICAEYGEIASFYEWAVDKAKELGWIPVSERLPEELPTDNCAWSERVRPSVDVLVKTKGSKQLYTAWYSYSYKEWTDVREEHSFTGVTHWMPLPELPKEDAK